MEITQYEKAVVENATWQQVVVALGEGMANIPSQYFQEYLEAVENIDVLGGVVAIATHSMGGRWWEAAEGVKEEFPFWEDPFAPQEGWTLLNGVDVTLVEISSATSGSSVTAAHCGGDPSTGWTVTLTVPIEEGVPYRGAYAKAFYNAFT